MIRQQVIAKKSYTTIGNICISLHDTGLFTCTCTSYRNSYTPLLASKNDAAHQNLFYAIVSLHPVKIAFYTPLFASKNNPINIHSDLIECFIIDSGIVRVSHYLYFPILYVSFWDESKGFCMAWWFLWRPEVSKYTKCIRKQLCFYVYVNTYLGSTLVSNR